MLFHQARRDDELEIVLLAVAPAQQLLDGGRCVGRDDTGLHAQFQLVQFRREFLAF